VKKLSLIADPSSQFVVKRVYELKIRLLIILLMSVWKEC
jgi:hypothetical protein